MFTPQIFPDREKWLTPCHERELRRKETHAMEWSRLHSFPFANCHAGHDMFHFTFWCTCHSVKIGMARGVIIALQIIFPSTHKFIREEDAYDDCCCCAASHAFTVSGTSSRRCSGVNNKYRAPNLRNFSSVCCKGLTP